MVLDRLSDKEIDRFRSRVAARGGPDPSLRPWLARELFTLWNATKNPELVSAQWNRLGPEDRQYWLSQAGRLLTTLSGD